MPQLQRSGVSPYRFPSGRLLCLEVYPQLYQIYVPFIFPLNKMYHNIGCVQLFSGQTTLPKSVMMKKFTFTRICNSSETLTFFHLKARLTKTNGMERTMKSLGLTSYLSLLLLLFSCSTNAEPVDRVIHGNAGSRLSVESFGTFNEPWAMTFLPGGDLLITEKKGTLLLFRPGGRTFCHGKTYTRD